MNVVDALVLKSLKGVGDGSVTKLLDFTLVEEITSLEELARLGVQNLPLRRIPENLQEFLTTGEFEVARRAVEDELRDWESSGIKVVYRLSDEYPRQLLDLGDPPPFLFCKGNWSLLKNPRAIAVVGTRNNSPTGKLIATKTVRSFHERSFAVVSGLALGIDAVAHKAALECGAPTIAVLVDLVKISPTTNKGLAEEILQKNGLLISENRPGTPTIAALFAKRDRIQSGLSTAVFAIETSKEGGTMHAVRAAAKMGRPIFVPDVDAAKYKDLTLDVIQGTQYLVKTNQARPYTSDSYDSISKELEGILRRFKSNGARDFQEGLQL
jgi:DNA processing protein